MTKETKRSLEEAIRAQADCIANLPESERGTDKEENMTKNMLGIVKIIQDHEKEETKLEVEQSKIDAEMEAAEAKANLEETKLEQEHEEKMKQFSLDETKLNNEHEEAINKMNCEAAAASASNATTTETTDKQLVDSKKGRILQYITLGVTTVLGIIGIVVKCKAFDKGMRFEETGTATSNTFRKAWDNVDKIK